MGIIIDKEKIEKAANKLCDYGSVYDSGYRIDGGSRRELTGQYKK